MGQSRREGGGFVRGTDADPGWPRQGRADEVPQPLVATEPAIAPPNTLGLRQITADIIVALAEEL